MYTVEREITKRERIYMMTVRRQLKRIQHAQRNADVVLVGNQMVSSLLAILSETERFTGAQIGAAYFLKPLIITATRCANVDGYDFIGALVTAIDDRYRIEPSGCRESDALPPS